MRFRISILRIENNYFTHEGSNTSFDVTFRWFPEVQNIFYMGNKRKQVPSNQDQERLESFFNCAATLMTENLQNLTLLSLGDYQDLLVQPRVRTRGLYVEFVSSCDMASHLAHVR